MGIRLQKNRLERKIISFKRKKLNFNTFNESNKGLAKDLVISYCFPPFVDTSGINMAKRVRENEIIVDVVQNDMTGMRDIDEHLYQIADEFIENRLIIDAEPSFGNWNLISEFTRKGMKALTSMVKNKGVYQSIYSRAMFPASHFLAFEFKLKYPETKWIAEFSDPLLYDITSKERVMKIQDPDYLKMVEQALKNINAPEYSGRNLFFLCEYLPYLFADEIVFTNKNQKEYMIDNFPIKEIQGTVEGKTVVKKHPTLPEEFYYLEDSPYPLNDDCVNFAYFGSFYETRNLNSVFSAFEHLKPEYQSKYRLHVFTNDKKSFKKSISDTPIKNNVIINSYRNYLEFLNLTTKFQCLIVNDTLTKDYKKINPYLPSKYSDYIGGGGEIWVICEEGSILSNYEVKYKSFLEDISSSVMVAQQIIDHYYD